jgi:hypothetical protein
MNTTRCEECGGEGGGFEDCTDRWNEHSTREVTCEACDGTGRRELTEEDREWIVFGILALCGFGEDEAYDAMSGYGRRAA